MAAQPQDVIADAETLRFNLDGRDIDARPGETIWQSARRHGVEIPHLCYKDGLRADGNCRACMVEIDGERVLAPSCCRTPTPDMKVKSRSERARRSQKLVLELLSSDTPDRRYVPDSRLEYWSGKLGLDEPRFAPRQQPRPDSSHPAIAVNLDACIQCTLCVRACREEQGNDVIGFAARGAEASIVFDLNDPMGESTCVACGECVAVCPTGALASAGVGLQEAESAVESVCPYCGVGCQVTYNVKDNAIIEVEGRNGPANEGRLCVKGRYGFDYVKHPHRLTKPLIRREDAPPKSADLVLDPANPLAAFREATWEEALDRAAGGLKRIRDEHGRYALAGFGCAKGSNEEAYLFQKLVRTGFGSNNVDHCTRLCHASSVAALLECVGSGAVSNPVRDVEKAEVAFIIGANPTVNHPVAATWIKNAVDRGTLKLIVADPRRGDLTRRATITMQQKPGSDVALLNAMMHTIINEGLTDEEFIRNRTEGFEALKLSIQGFSPEAMAPICGVPAETLRQAARLYATSKGSMILWGMGISQHIHGTNNSRCLIALALMTGQIGRPGTGLHPLRGQNNVQGASDVGLIPMSYPDYLSVTDPDARQFFEKLWGCELESRSGLTAIEIIDAIHDGGIRGMYIMGENPAMSDPNVHHARAALAALEHLVVQDLFLTETAYNADVVLPATGYTEKTGTFTNTDRLVQLGRQALKPPHEVRQDLWIIQEIARRIGLDWAYDGPAEVFMEMRKAMPSIAGITWERLERDHAVVYPCLKEGDPGEAVVFTETFPRPGGQGLFVPCEIVAPDEIPDEEYPFVLITGRQLEHWHTGSMTRRSRVLDAIEPEAVCTMSPEDLEALGVEPGGLVTLDTRRGQITVYARADSNMARGSVFMAFCYYEAAVNLLSNPALDPVGKIPELKYCALRVRAGGDPMQVPSYGGGLTAQAMA